MDIKMPRDPYGDGLTTCRRKMVHFDPGVTVIAGCNGAGKTTMCKCIKEDLYERNINYIEYDDVSEGGHNSVSKLMFSGNINIGASLLSSSKGEGIEINLGIFFSKVREYIITGKTGDNYRKYEDTNERWIILDNVDCGYSLDNILELIDLLNLIVEDSKQFNVDLYIIITSNTYELSKNFRCIDCMEGSEVTFKTYNSFKKFVLKSKDKKIKRLERLENKR